MKNNIKISPFNGSKKARLITDAANSTGCGYCLFQLRDPKDSNWELGVNIISAGSTLFKTTDLSPIDAELTGLVFAATASDYWLSYCSGIQLYTDCNGLIAMLGKSIADVQNTKHRKLLEKVQRYDFQGIHIKGEENCITECLSRLTNKFLDSIYTISEKQPLRILP